MAVGETDCIFAGPPCQSFSLAGRREGLNDERGLLVFRFIELVRELRPKTFVLENVKGVVNWQGGVVLRKVEKMLEEPLPTGEMYKVQDNVLNAADFGVPQNRERVFIVGSRVKSTYRSPEPTHAAKPSEHDQVRLPHVTVGQVLRGLRHEWLDQDIFETIEEAQYQATQWLWTYNNDWPNTAIGGITPAMKLKIAA